MTKAEQAMEDTAEQVPPVRPGSAGIDANDILFPESIPTFKFEAVGDSIEGVIVKHDASQQTDIATREPLWWEDGRPRMQTVLTLLTAERDPDIEDDDGRRRVFVKSDMMRAVRDAVKHAGKRKIVLGATIAIRREKDGLPPRVGLSAPKGYQAIYTVPEAPFD